MNAAPNDVDSYLANVPDEMRPALQTLRATIKAIAPDAVESISYGLPTFKHRGRALVYFGAWKNHCALYGLPIDEYRDELAAYDTAKGTIRFSPQEPLPAALVEKLLRSRMAQIEAARNKRRKSSTGS